MLEDLDIEYPPPADAEMALFDAVSAGDTAKVKKLLDDGADAKATWILRTTPLHKAAQRGFIDIARLLLDARADINARTDWNDFTPLSLAIENHQTEMVRLLLAYGVSTQKQGFYPRTPLQDAEQYGFADIATLLREYGAK